MSKPNLIEVRSIDYVPLGERRGKVWHLWPVWFTGDTNLATLAIGAIGITMHLDFAWSVIAIVSGCALGTFFMAFHSTQGPQLGLPQMIQSRPQFGFMGALVVWGVALVTYIGYNSINHLIADQAAHQLLGSQPRSMLLPFGVAAVAIALIGYDLIHFAQRWLAYFMIAALLVFTVGASFTLHMPARQLELSGFSAPSFLTQFFAAAAYQLSWSIYVSDYSRYLPRDVGVRASFWWTYLGAMIGGVWTMLVGAIAAALHPSLEIIAAVGATSDAIFPGLGPALLVGALLGLLTISALNFYGASLTLLSIADSLKPMPTTLGRRVGALLVCGAAALLIAFQSSGDLIKTFDQLLSIFLYLFTPWTAINLIDFYVVRKGSYSVREIFNANGLYGRWNWHGLSAYGLGFTAMIPFFSTDFYTGPIARALNGADLSMLIGLPVSALVYLWSYRGFDFQDERRKVLKADSGLEGESAAECDVHAQH